MSKLINEINNRYGLLTVKEYIKNDNGQTGWLCQCDCGNTKIVKGSRLRDGSITTCGPGCTLKFLRNPNFKNLINQKFGRLTVLELVEVNKNHKTVWRCQCDCGNICTVIGAHLTSGAIQSCGCLHREQLQEKLINKNILGKKYNFLTVIDVVYDEKKHIVWKCQCDCGNIVFLPAAYITSNNTKSCGCLKSFYEYQIEQILKDNNIIYQREYIFSNLRSQKNRNLRFDFAILNQNNQIQCLIEYNGDQHYQPIELYGGQEYFQTLQHNDMAKIDYCKQHHYPLLILNKKNYSKEKLLNFIYGVNKYNEI